MGETFWAYSSGFQGLETFFTKKSLSFIFISLHFLFHLLSLLHLVSSLVLLLLSSCPLSSPLLSCLVLSCLVLSCLSFSVFFLRVMLCVVLCGVCRCGRGVCLCVLRHAEKTWKNRYLASKAPPCIHSKSPCVPAPRAHVLKHVRVVPVHTGTF